MDRTNFYKWASFFLLVLNTGLITFVLLGNRHGGHPPKPDKLIIEGMKLDELQIHQFEELKREHRHFTDSVEILEKEARSTLFGELAKETPDTLIMHKNIEFMASCKQVKDMATLKHFNDLKSICKPEQLPDYFATIEELGKIMLHAGPPHKK